MNCYYDALLGMCICIEEPEIPLALLTQIFTVFS